MDESCVLLLYRVFYDEVNVQMLTSPFGYCGVLIVIQLSKMFPVVVYQNFDEICNGQHSNKVLCVAVPQY